MSHFENYLPSLHKEILLVFFRAFLRISRTGCSSSLPDEQMQQSEISRFWNDGKSSGIHVVEQ